MIRNLLIFGIALAVTTISARAADLPSRMPPPVLAPAPMWSWTGVYAGINAGYGGDRFKYDGIDTGTGEAGQYSDVSSGFLGGVQIGYNWQFPVSNIVLGLEADAQATSIRSEFISSFVSVDAAGSIDAGTKLQWFGTVRGRAGYAFGQVMPYLTGGFAYGQTQSFAYGSAGFGGDGITNYSKTGNPTGWTLGAGLEYAITNNLTFKTEYLYVDLGKNAVYALPDDVGGIAMLNARTTLNVVRAGLNYKFDVWAPPAPVVAKY